MSRIAFIGIGAIGLPMAKCLLAAGHDVLACDRNAEALRGFAQAGGRVTQTARACAAEEIVVFMVADDAQLLDSIQGPDGLLSGLPATTGGHRPGLFIVMSTVAPDTVRTLARDLALLGIRIVDAPVSGGPVAAADGRLSIMAGGAPADLDAARPVLNLLGQTLHTCGPLGTGALTKIVNNLVGVTTLMLLAEGLQLAQRNGADLAHLTAVMEASSGRNASSADWARTREIFDDFSLDLPRAASLLRINAKDMKLALKLGEQAGIRMPILRAAFEATSAMSPEELRERMRAIL